MGQQVCFACKSPCSDDVVCDATQQVGFKCFTCGSSGHLDKNESALEEGVILYLPNCPSCGESNVYCGASTLSGIAIGSCNPAMIS